MLEIKSCERARVQVEHEVKNKQREKRLERSLGKRQRREEGVHVMNENAERVRGKSRNDKSLLSIT